MSQQNIFSPTRKFIGYVILALLFFVVVGLFSVNFIAGLATAAGVIIYLLYIKLLKSVRRKYLLHIFSAVISSFVILCVGIYYFSPLSMSPLCPISFYRIVAIPQSDQLKSITIQESVILKEGTDFQPPSTWSDTYIDGEKGYKLPETVATISPKGFLLKEASFQPSADCSSSISLELDDFPRNSFLAAHKAQDLKINPYIDTETITWSSSYEEIRFSYIVPPFQVFKPILSPLLGASSINQWLMGLASMIGAFIFTPYVKPVLTEIAQKAVKNKITDLEIQTQQDEKISDSKKGKKERN